jgi:hypothetical protein
MAGRHITRKTVINNCYGGFRLSDEARVLCNELHAARKEPRPQCYEWIGFGSYRFDPILIRVIEQLGSKRASGKYAKLEVVTVCAMHLDNSDFNEYDGLETITLATECPRCKEPDVFPTRKSTIRVRHFSV